MSRTNARYNAQRQPGPSGRLGRHHQARRGPARTQRLTIRVWTSEEVIDRLFEVYERLPDDMRARIPLKRTWILDVSEAG